MVVLFDITKVPRTVSREEWYKLHRRVRVMRKDAKAMNDRQLAAIRSMPDCRIKRDLIDQQIYPPIILGPYQ